MKTILGLGALFCTCYAHAIMIDDFTTGAYSGSLGTGSIIVQQTGTMIGGQRDLLMAISANPYSQQLNQTIGGGMSITSTGTGIMARIGLQYDDFDVENPIGSTFNSGNGFPFLDLTGQTIRLDFLANDRDLATRIELAGSGVSAYNWVIAGNQDVPFTVDIPVSLFTGNVNIAHVDLVTVYFDTRPAGDFALGSLQAVPEPTTFVVIACAAGLMFAGRKRFIK